MSTVLQLWFEKMPWKMQSIFMNGLRAPDSKTDGVKKCVRWMRTKTCNDADPNKPDCYMTAPVMDVPLIDKVVDEAEYLTCHYTHHLADALRVISIYHPDAECKDIAKRIHYLIAEEIFHFVPETDEQFVHRHRDMTEHV